MTKQERKIGFLITNSFSKPAEPTSHFSIEGSSGFLTLIDGHLFVWNAAPVLVREAIVASGRDNATVVVVDIVG